MSERTVYIGRKPLMAYITAILSATAEGKVTVSARGKLISKAVSAVLFAEQHARGLGKRIKIGRVAIGSETIGEPPRMVSRIKIGVDVK